MAFFAAKFSPDNEARCGYSWQRRTNNDEHRGSSRTALKRFTLRIQLAAAHKHEQATRLAPRATEQRGNDLKVLQRGALRTQLAAGVTNNSEQRLTGQARCENSWQRRTSNDEQRGSSGTALGTICAANTAGSGAKATRLAPRAQLTARIAVNQSKQRSHATYLTHTRRVSWQVAQAQTTPNSRLIFAAKNRRI